MAIYLTSESVTEGHPDKICDQVSDAILDAHLTQDPRSRVAVETLTTTGLLLIAGEVTSRAQVDYQRIAREVLRSIGYDDPSFGIDHEDAAILTAVHGQSPDIALGVDEREDHEQGAGDQGMMYGYACDETLELLPLPIVLAHRLTRRLATTRKDGTLPWLGPDGKAQVTIQYDDGRPSRASTIVVSTQHRADIPLARLREEIVRHVLLPTCADWVDDDTEILINPTGRFVVGGPEGDTGVTGRKIIVDTYGGIGRHGGGAFSGKDPSKVDRSGAYAARWVAKTVVASGLARRCEVQVSYAIGVARPVSLHVDTFGTGTIEDERIARAVLGVFDLRPKAIIGALRLDRPIYRKTAAYGHFGRDDPDFTWEDTSRASVLREEVQRSAERTRSARVITPA